MYRYGKGLFFFTYDGKTECLVHYICWVSTVYYYYFFIFLFYYLKTIPESINVLAVVLTDLLFYNGWERILIVFWYFHEFLWLPAICARDC